MQKNSTAENFKKSQKLAIHLFPNEKWLKTENNIFVAKGRLEQWKKETEKQEKEMAQVRILTQLGSVAFFLPESAAGQSEQRCADIILNGTVTEMKVVTGKRETLGWEFKKGYKQGKSLIQRFPDIKEHSVFIRLLSDLPVDSVRAKIAGELKERTGGGKFICFFETTNKLYTWDYDELRSIIRHL